MVGNPTRILSDVTVRMCVTVIEVWALGNPELTVDVADLSQPVVVKLMTFMVYLRAILYTASWVFPSYMHN